MIVGGLQPEDHPNHDRELNQGKSEQASYWSRNEFDHEAKAPGGSSQSAIQMHQGAMSIVAQ
jgi:hypothetical protein